jgi:allantoin racemase
MTYEFDGFYAITAMAGAVQPVLHQPDPAAVHDDRAEVIILGCGGMTGLDQRIQQECGVPVVGGISAAVPLAESLVAMHLSTSKVRTYAAPRPKRITGWPITGGSPK